jgi:hypothetical protein
MRLFPIGLALAMAAETAALACSCLPPGTPAQSRPLAREAVKRAVAIVDVQVLSDYSAGGAGERVRVRRTLWGKAPAEFRIERSDHASSASCDALLEKGQRKLLILYPARNPRQRGRQFAMQSLCSDYLVSDRGFLQVTLEEARRRRP